MKNKIKLSIVGVLFLSNAYAQESITLKPLEIKATAIQADELHATQSVEIYTQKDIEAAHVENLYEFFNKETSLITMPSYGNLYTQKLDMRGFGITDGYQNIVIKVNGRKLNNVDMVPQLLSSISPNQVERIEIIKSSGIVENGDGANAGVINIITKESNGVSIGAYVGIYNTFDGNFYVGHSDEVLRLNVSGEAKRSGGIRHIDDTGAKDSSKFSNFAFDLAYTPIESVELRLNALTSYIDTWYAGSLTQKEYDENIYQKGDSNWGATHQIYTSDVIGVGASYFIGDSWSFNGDFAHEYKTSEYVTYNSKYRYIYNSFTINAKYDSDKLHFVVGMDGFNGDRRQSGKKTSKDNLAGYIQVRYNLGANSFHAGYRYEKVTYTHEETNLSLDDNEKLDGIEVGYNYALSKEQSFYLNYTKSYQAPDIDRFFKTPWGGTTQFNGFIKPSKANSYTLGYNNITASNKLKVSVYYIDLEDEIYYYKDPAFIGSKNTNIDSSYKYGLDLYDKYIISQEFNVVFNYNYVMAIIDKEIENGEDFSGNELPGVSNHNLKLSLNYLPNQHTTLTLTQVYRSEAYAANDFANEMKQKQDPYYSTDIAATYSTKSWDIFAKINNIFNQKNGLWIADDKIYPVNYTTTALVGLKLKY